MAVAQQVHEVDRAYLFAMLMHEGVEAEVYEESSANDFQDCEAYIAST